MEKVIVGIDLGGTIVRAGAFDSQGKLRVVRETPIEAARGPEFGLSKIQGLVEQVLAESGTASLVGIGIGSTGPLDPVRGLINNPFTLPTWENVPILEWMQESFDVPVTLENDADTAALGEYWQGAGQTAKRLYAVTVGTGIGTASSSMDKFIVAWRTLIPRAATWFSTLRDPSAIVKCTAVGKPCAQV